MIQYVAVLPAYAGMFLPIWTTPAIPQGSPRVCGDVSGALSYAETMFQFSPRMRGCFPESCRRGVHQDVLPAYAGMFPSIAALGRHTPSSPRVCGDVSISAIRPMKDGVFSPRMRGCFLDLSPYIPKSLVLPAYAGMFP